MIEVLKQALEALEANDQLINGNGTKGYGIQIPAALDNFNITGASFHDNGQGAISNASGNSSTKVIQSNFGYVTQNSGTATISAGATSFVVTHGLSAQPQVIELTPLGQPESGAWYAGNTTSTQFTIYVGATTTGTRQFFWRASVPGQ